MKFNKVAILVQMDAQGLRWQKDLAELSGVSRITISAGMCGKNISAATAAKIAAALGTDVSKITLKEKKVSRRGKRSAKEAETENTIAG